MTERPDIRIDWSTADRVLVVAAALALGACWLLPAFAWAGLPQRIPTHFGFGGEPDAWGGRITILALPAIATGIHALMTVVSWIPHRYNYPWAITPGNAAAQYRLGRRVILLLQLYINLLLAGLEWAMIAVAAGRIQSLPQPLLFALGGPFVIVGWYLVASHRVKTES